MNSLGIPDSPWPRVVIAGVGFGGLKAARILANKKVQVVLLDKNNYFQFQPLFYQVAMSGIEPGSISFPVRKIFHRANNIHIRCANIQRVNTSQNSLITDIGEVSYDYLLLGMGAKSNFFGNAIMESNCIGMKSVSESLFLRNRVLEIFENNVSKSEKDQLLNIAVIGGGPTGVELCGALAEMRKKALMRDYPEIDFKKMRILLFEGSDRVLSNFSEKSSKSAAGYLSKMGVEMYTNVRVQSFENNILQLNNGVQFSCAIALWAAGIKANTIEGLPENAVAPNGRLICDDFLKVQGTLNVFACGDQALVSDIAWPKGHPQVAQPAIQQGKLFAKNVLRAQEKMPLQGFQYKDKGSMATIGRNKAVVEMGKLKFAGFFAWVLWLTVHLMAIVGVKNRLFIFINWMWSYFSYDQSLRIWIRPYKKS